MPENIQIIVFWDQDEWAAEAEDLDEDGNFDNSAYSIENPESSLLAELNQLYSYEAWGMKVGRRTVRVVEIGDVLGVDES